MFSLHTPEEQERFEQARRARTLALLAEFTAFVEAHPHLRFWQALCTWVTHDTRWTDVWLSRNDTETGERIERDPFYFESKDR